MSKLSDENMMKPVRMADEILEVLKKWKNLITEGNSWIYW
jgi:hypothetical protein